MIPARGEIHTLFYAWLKVDWGFKNQTLSDSWHSLSAEVYTNMLHISFQIQVLGSLHSSDSSNRNAMSLTWLFLVIYTHLLFHTCNGHWPLASFWKTASRALFSFSRCFLPNCSSWSASQWFGRLHLRLQQQVLPLATGLRRMCDCWTKAVCAESVYG